SGSAAYKLAGIANSKAPAMKFFKRCLGRGCMLCPLVSLHVLLFKSCASCESQHCDVTLAQAPRTVACFTFFYAHKGKKKPLNIASLLKRYLAARGFAR